MPHPKNQVTYRCEVCGVDFSVKASRGHVRFCGARCFQEYRTSRHMTTTCQHCGKTISTYASRPARYCSKSCAITARNLTDANPSYHRDISGTNNPMYGKGTSGAANGMYGRTRDRNPAWSGGRKIRADGYVMVLAPENHPSGSDYILEHRFIMEQHLGRYLEPHEVVHHIDGNPSNNDISNLRLFSSQAEHIKVAHSGK